MELPVVVTGRRSHHKRLPPWLKKKWGHAEPLHQMKVQLRARGLHTVCEEASCPNIGECWAAGTATFMILGDICTRHCGFCDVRSGRPRPVDPEEPQQLAAMVKRLQLRHVVITCVARDDLEDRGAAQFARCIQAVRYDSPSTSVEILSTDFSLLEPAIEEVVKAGPDVMNHNVETVRRLTPRVRHRFRYEDSLRFLALVKAKSTSQVTKSGLMLGLGETDEEIEETLHDLRSVDCDIVTIGQYLRPARRNLSVVDYVLPERFAEWERRAREMGFRSVASGPFVRSSYHAEDLLGAP